MNNPVVYKVLTNLCNHHLLVKNVPAMQETWVRSLGWEDPLEKGKTTHLSIPVLPTVTLHSPGT